MGRGPVAAREPYIHVPWPESASVRAEAVSGSNLPEELAGREPGGKGQY